MVEYTITCEITDAEDVALNEMALAIGVTIPEFFQRFWDGYTSDGVTMTGAVRAQVNQWLADAVKAKLKTMDAATALGLLS